MTRLLFLEWNATEGWTMRKLASTLNVSPGTVQHWRDGTSPIPPCLPLALIALTGRRRAEKRTAQIHTTGAESVRLHKVLSAAKRRTDQDGGPTP